MSRKKKTSNKMAVLALRGLMIFPHMVLHFDVGRPKSVAALEKAMDAGEQIFLVSQKDAEVEDPKLEDLCAVGTVVSVKQVLNLPGDAIRVLVEGESRGVITEMLSTDPCMEASIEIVDRKAGKDTETKALSRTLRDYFSEYVDSGRQMPQETINSVL